MEGWIGLEWALLGITKLCHRDEGDWRVVTGFMDGCWRGQRRLTGMLFYKIFYMKQTETLEPRGIKKQAYVGNQVSFDVGTNRI